MDFLGGKIRDVKNEKCLRRQTADELLRRLEKTNKLPLGHYDREEVQGLVKQEYNLCKNLEAKFYRYNRIISPEESAKIVGKMVRFLSLKPVKRLVFNDPDIRYAGGAYLSTEKEIKFPGDRTNLLTLIHELTHHVMYTERIRGDSHGPEFVEMEQLMLETVVQLLED